MKLNDVQTRLSNSLANGFIDPSFNGTEELMSRFIYNNPGDSMLMHIERELDHCSAFTFVIAFVTESALTALKVKLADLASRSVHGRILTADYFTFNAPKTFQELQKLPNVEVKIADVAGFHAKGYIFGHQEKFQTKDKVEPIVRMQLRLKQATQYDKYLLFEK